MNAMPALEDPTLAQLFGDDVDRCDVMQLCVNRVDTLAEVDRILLCSTLPKTVRRTAERHKAVLEDIQARAGDGRRLRELLVSENVALRSGAMKLCRRLIAACP